MIKCDLLSHSLDPNIVALYKTRESLNAKLKRVWKATNIVKEANAEVNLDLKFPANPTNKELDLENLTPIHLLQRKENSC